MKTGLFSKTKASPGEKKNLGRFLLVSTMF